MPPGSFSEVLRAPNFEGWLKSSIMYDVSHDKFLYNLGCWFRPTVEELRAFDPDANGPFTKYSWLSDFDAPRKSNCETSLEAFRESPNDMTRVLLGWLETGYKELFGAAVEFFHRKDTEENSERDLRRDQPTSDQVPPDTIGKGVLEAAKACDCRDWLGADRLDGVAENVRNFCLEAGCPQTSSNPFLSVDALRTTVFHAASTGRDSMLLARIKHLENQHEEQRKQLEKQSRIITNLSYRHILEGLSDFPTKVTPEWKIFWNKAFTTAENELKAPIASGGTAAITHPLTKVLRDFNPMNRRNVKDVGERMYGTLSSNIHQYHGAYEVDRNQWDNIPGAILEALRPTEFDVDGNIDWTKERAKH